jgi:hypothetical protein
MPRLVYASRPFPGNALEQQLDAASINAVALHHKPDQGIFYQLGERALGDVVVHDISPGPPRRNSFQIRSS